MTLQNDNTLFLAHCKAHKTLTINQPCKKLIMLSPQTINRPADRNTLLHQHITSTNITLYFAFSILLLLIVTIAISY